jgi:glycine dehydrogenase subunit 2
MMIEPTESESKAELDAFVDAMVRIYQRARENAEADHEAPRLAKRTRLDETRAARRPILRWSPDETGPHF